MPITITCPECDRTIQAPDEAAGRTGRCPCGASLAIPGVSEALAFLESPGHSSPRPSKKKSAGLMARKPPTPVRPGEPWFYAFIEGYAKLVMGLAVAGFVITFLASLIGSMNLEGGIFTFLAGVITAFVVMLLVLLIAAPIFLAVDVARNIRAMRIAAEK